jgi:hypothetical protein
LVLADDGLIHQILEPGLVIRVEEGVAQHPVIGDAIDVQMVFESDSILGQGSRFIGAKNIHGAEVLNRVDVLDDDLLSCPS